MPATPLAKRAILFALAAWQLSATAADVIPAHLVGVWGTAESLYAGTTAQAELYLQADGTGMLVGSSAPALHATGADKGKPDPTMRVVLGVPLRATLEGDVLSAQPFGMPGDRMPPPEEIRVACRYDGASATLACKGPKPPDMLMKRRSATLPAEAVKAISDVFIAAAAYAGKAGAIRPAPSTQP
ncbi:hypothetical protein [Massilia yuzhufengensis]|uniref:Uncharacterized protein n=1 Tax=Massilia yuzhufengensis TaxID=1164594 RepID=A0A1I1KPI9_9BURK|nr:hypothetical protein [Massilia yuzhufengensis]SFC62697.1 hypothetical protein SAMN05216204_10864 [Massilia yuzhufengensis]